MTSIGESAFCECITLTYVKIPDSIKRIMAHTFLHCLGLTSVNIPNSVTSIERYAFADCQSLSSITIPNSVTSIGNNSFSNCKNLKIVTLGSGIHTIDSCAFEKCQNLELVYCHATTPPSCDISSFKDSYIEYSKLFVPKESIAAYKNADGWKDFGTIKAIEKKDGTKP